MRFRRRAGQALRYVLAEANQAIGFFKSFVFAGEGKTAYYRWPAALLVFQSLW